jgi:hypothetical protein
MCCKLHGNILQKYFYLAHYCSLRIEHITFVVAENQERFHPAEVHPRQLEWCWYVNTQVSSHNKCFVHYLTQIT